jgi:uncharacterized membrane protein
MRNKFKFGLWDLLLLGIGLIPLIVAVIYYTKLPEQLAIHFQISDNKPNGYMAKSNALLVIGLITIGIPLLMKITRLIDPKRINYDKFGGTFELIRLCASLLVSGLMLVTIIYNLGYSIDLLFWVILGMGLFFIVLGNVMGRIRYNFFVGIRTPWTLASEEVWRRTHRLAGPLSMIAGIVMLVSLFFTASRWIFLFAIFIFAVVPTVYSYFISLKVTQK